jgi:antitoxin YefM
MRVPYCLSRRAAPDALVMSRDHYSNSSLMETVCLLNSPANAAHLARSISQLRAGQIQERELIETGENGKAIDEEHNLHH